MSRQVDRRTRDRVVPLDPEAGTREPRRCHGPGLGVLAAVLSLALAGRSHSAAGGEASPWIGQEVVLKSAAAALELGERGVYRRYRVEQVEDDWLWLASATGSPVGWVKAGDALPLVDAVAYFTRRIRDDPTAAWAYHRRALAWLDRGEVDIALADYADAIRLDPADALARSNRGLAWLARREYDRAIADFDAALRLDPASALAHDQRGLARAARNESGRALADFNEAVRLDPLDTSARVHRARAQARAGRYAAALADYAEAIRHDPEDPAAQNGLAWLLATCPAAPLRDGPRAVALATRTNELSGWKNPYHLGTLAAAQAEAGHFDAAVTWQSSALERFPDDDPDLPDHRARLELYRARKPYHEGRPQS